jgi:hypothetical protein
MQTAPAGPSPKTIDPPRPPRRLGRRTAAEWYAIVVGALLAIRGATTLLAGASFMRPGDGWRAVFQLSVACVLLLSARGRESARRAVLGVGLLYVIITVLGLVNGHDVLGVIPVDTRDKVVHPLLAIVALTIVALEARRAGAAARTL